MNLLAADEGVTGVSWSAVADALVVLGHAGGVHSTAIHTRVFAVEVGETSLGDVAVFILQALNLFATLALVVRITNVEAIGTGTFWQMVIHNADSTGCTLQKLAAILASTFTICFIELAHFIRVQAV